MKSCEDDLQCVAAFDFDVTITTKDTFVPFLERAFGHKRMRSLFLQLSPEALKVVLGLSSRDVFKERIIRSLFSGESVDRLREIGRLHATEILNLVRPAARRRIEWHKSRGDRLVMVSASLSLYLEPVAQVLGFDDLLCTRPSVNQRIFDGGIVGKNCRGPEKVQLLSGLLGNLAKYNLYAYGDSVGDREMLEVANHAYFRAFEPRGELYLTPYDVDGP
jgi:phosphatidylglycerophosphatase C